MEELKIPDCCTSFYHIISRIPIYAPIINFLEIHEYNFIQYNSPTQSVFKEKLCSEYTCCYRSKKDLKIAMVITEASIIFSSLCSQKYDHNSSSRVINKLYLLITQLFSCIMVKYIFKLTNIK